MSESEQMGRCRMEITAAYESTRFKPSDSDMLIADAIDRLAADVAAIKEAVCDGSVAAAIRERDEARAEAERFKAVVHSDAGHMARILIENERLKAERAAPQPAAPPPWWLTEEERAQIKHLLLIQRHNTGWTTERHAELDRILARAGSPPVVEVPAISRRDVPMQNEAFAYRDAMDKAGVKWKEKEVGRE